MLAALPLVVAPVKIPALYWPPLIAIYEVSIVPCVEQATVKPVEIGVTVSQSVCSTPAGFNALKTFVEDRCRRKVSVVPRLSAAAVLMLQVKLEWYNPIVCVQPACPVVFPTE